jgi:DNA invertase Pin-like site-specific DNA recombinase
MSHAKIVRAALYLRVSTSSQGQYGERREYDQRPEVQEGPLRRHADLRGWSVTNVYVDRLSGATRQRPGLETMLRDARAGRFDVLMVWRFDRLSRSVADFLSITDELRALNIDLVSHEQAFDTTTPMGKFTLTMFAALSELERQVICERITAGLEYARRNGTKSGKPIGRPIAVFDRHQIAELRRKGHSWREIASALGVGVGTVRRAYPERAASAQPCQNLQGGNCATGPESSGVPAPDLPVPDSSGFGTPKSEVMQTKEGRNG